MVTAVAASGSVTQAARDLHLTQSAVSHQLRAIESRLGTPLFLRMGKRMVVTAAGGRILETASRVLDEIKAAEEDVRRRAAGEASVIRVCAQCNTGYHWLPPLIDAFRQKHPAVDVSIAVECTMRPLEALLEGLLDVAIVTDAVRSSHVRTRPLFEDEHAAIVAPDHRFAAQAFVSPKDLADERLLLYSSSPDDSFTIAEDPQAGGRCRQARVVRHAHGSDPRDGEGAARRQRHADMGDCAGAPRRGRPGRPHHRFRHSAPVASGDAHPGGPCAARRGVHRSPGRARHAGPAPAADCSPRTSAMTSRSHHAHRMAHFR